MLSPLLRGAAPWQANSRLLLSPRSKRLLELLALEDGHLFFVAACHSWRNCFPITVLESRVVGAAGRAAPCHAGMPCACLQLVGAFGAAEAEGSGDLFKAGRW